MRLPRIFQGALLLLCLPVLVLAEGDPVKLEIRGSLAPTGLEHLGKPVTVISKSELQEQGASNVGAVLSHTPGVSSSYFGPSAQRPIIRGQGKERVRVVENGLEAGDVSATSDDHALTPDALSVESIEVLRGPATLLYGNGAIGGVVNIEDGSIAESNLNKDFSGDLQLQQGDSADEEQLGSIVMRAKSLDFNWYLSANHRESDSIEIPGYAESWRLRAQEESEHELEHEGEGEDHADEHAEEEEAYGTLENSFARNTGTKFGFSKVWGKSFAGASVAYRKSDYGIPGAHTHEHGDAHEEEGHAAEAEEELVDDHSEALPRIDMEQVRFEGKAGIDLGNNFARKLNLSSSYSNYEHSEIEGSETATTFKRDAYELRGGFMHAFNNGVEGEMGTQLNYDEASALGEEAFLPKTDTVSPGIYVVEEIPFTEDSHFELGSRYTYTSVDPVGQSQETFQPLSASAAYVWEFVPTEYTLTLSGSFSERAPNATELFADGPHLATQAYEQGSSDLGLERSQGVELFVRKVKGRTRGSVGAFLQHFDDFIGLLPTDQEIDDLQVYQYTMQRARFWGAEAQIDYDIIASGPHQLTFSNQIDYVRADNLSTDQPLPRITPLRGQTGFDYRYGPVKFMIEAQMIAEQDRVADYELPTSGYVLYNAQVAYQVPDWLNADWEFYLRGENLGDRSARVHTSFLKDTAPLEGQAFRAGLVLHF